MRGGGSSNSTTSGGTVWRRRKVCDGDGVPRPYDDGGPAGVGPPAASSLLLSKSERFLPIFCSPVPFRPSVQPSERPRPRPPLSTRPKGAKMGFPPLVFSICTAKSTGNGGACKLLLRPVRARAPVTRTGVLHSEIRRSLRSMHRWGNTISPLLAPALHWRRQPPPSERPVRKGCLLPSASRNRKGPNEHPKRHRPIKKAAPHLLETSYFRTPGRRNAALVPARRL